MPRAGKMNITTASKKVLSAKRGRAGIILNHVSGGEVTYVWGADVTAKVQEGIIVNSTKSALVLDDGSPMYEEELHAIGSASAVVSFHEIGGPSTP